MKTPIEKHLQTKVVVNIEDLRSMWVNVSDKVRMEMLKSLIWTAPSSYEFHRKVQILVSSEAFQDTLD